MSARRVLTIGVAAVLLSLAASTMSAGVPPCVEEDSAGPCYWDATTRGNGVGVSFTVDSSQVVHHVTMTGK